MLKKDIKLVGREEGMDLEEESKHTAQKYPRTNLKVWKVWTLFGLSIY